MPSFNPTAKGFPRPHTLPPNGLILESRRDNFLSYPLLRQLNRPTPVRAILKTDVLDTGSINCRSH
jgi:hypothetical protein